MRRSELATEHMVNKLAWIMYPLLVLFKMQQTLL